MAEVFSSANLKERDKRVEERHRKELSALERKIENLRRSNDDTRRQLFDAIHRTERLANSLGFANVMEAQETLDLLDEPVSFKDTLARVESLETELRNSRIEAEEAEAKLVAVEEIRYAHILSL
jgi:phage-related tail protein